MVSSLQAEHPDAAQHLDEASEDLLAFTGFPRQLWRQIYFHSIPASRGTRDSRGDHLRTTIGRRCDFIFNSG
ncbi:transposase [Actinomadura adrarensis]|uniref:Transposase n=1 Tax=Actinomadura adrarensis TaxID=1819600 RepID=A0ABW3CJQ2_9ACTN